jgi:hypothetical protein
MLMAVMVLVLTVIGAVAVTLPDFAVMVVDPKATAVASPELSIVATLVEEDSHVTCDVTSLVVSFPKVPVAVNCWVVPGVIIALVGDSEIETMLPAAGKKPPQLLSSTAARNPAPSLPSHFNRCTLIILRSQNSQSVCRQLRPITPSQRRLQYRLIDLESYFTMPRIIIRRALMASDSTLIASPDRNLGALTL